jgi:hypothetical protein
MKIVWGAIVLVVVITLLFFPTNVVGWVVVGLAGLPLALVLIFIAVVIFNRIPTATGGARAAKWIGAAVILIGGFWFIRFYFSEVKTEGPGWRLCFTIEAEDSLDGNTSGCNPATVLRYSEASFEIVVEYRDKGAPKKCILNWDRSVSGREGTWQQPSPPDSGTWYLEPVSEDRFTGYFTSVKTGKTNLLSLER